MKGGMLRFGTERAEADEGNVVTEPQAIANYGMIGRGPGCPVRAEPESFCGQHKMCARSGGGILLFDHRHLVRLVHLAEQRHDRRSTPGFQIGKASCWERG